MRVTNVDTLSSYIDRLIVERIKHYFFNDELKLHQEQIIKEIKSKLSELFIQTFSEEEYKYLGERRTFVLEGIIQEIDHLVTNNLNIGQGDRTRLEEIKKDSPNLKVILENEKLTRISNENRSKNKNKIDEQYSKLW